MATAREMAKAKRRQEILAAAAKIMAEKGFHQTRLGDVGAAVGISGPGLYRHFDSKEALLADILTEISIRLVDGARDAFLRNELTAESDPGAVINELIAMHVEVAMTEPDLIRVEGREIENLEEGVREKYIFIDGDWRDHHSFALTADEAGSVVERLQQSNT